MKSCFIRKTQKNTKLTDLNKNAGTTQNDIKGIDFLAQDLL